MAKKKTEDLLEQTEATLGTETIETNETETPEILEGEQTDLEPNEYVKKILQSFPNYKTLYVDSKGGVFSPDTNQKAVGKAILYQNPFYKNN